MLTLMNDEQERNLYLVDDQGNTAPADPNDYVAPVISPTPSPTPPPSTTVTPVTTVIDAKQTYYNALPDDIRAIITQDELEAIVWRMQNGEKLEDLVLEFSDRISVEQWETLLNKAFHEAAKVADIFTQFSEFSKDDWELLLHQLGQWRHGDSRGKIPNSKVPGASYDWSNIKKTSLGFIDVESMTINQVIDFYRWFFEMHPHHNDPKVIVQRVKNEIDLLTLLMDSGIGYLKIGDIQNALLLLEVAAIVPSLNLSDVARRIAKETPFDAKQWTDLNALETLFAVFYETNFVDQIIEVIKHDPVLSATLATKLVANTVETFLSGKLGKAYEKYTGKGGFSERTNPLAILGSLAFALLDVDSVPKNLKHQLIDNWPLRTTQGYAYYPTTEGVFIYAPNTPGPDIKYFANLWPGWMNSIIAVLNKVPMVSNYIRAFDQIGGFVSGLADGKNLTFETYATKQNYLQAELKNIALQYSNIVVSKVEDRVNDKVETLPSVGDSQVPSLVNLDELLSNEKPTNELDLAGDESLQTRGLLIIKY